MFNVHQMIFAGNQLLTKNAPAILTAFGAVGVVGTAVLTAKASFEAAERISDERTKRNLQSGTSNPFTKTEKVQLVWPLYIGAVSSGVLSCGAIVLSHRISSRRAAVLAAAYALNEGKLEEYQDKIREKFGEKKASEVDSEIYQDRIEHDYEENEVYFSPTDGKVLIREDYTGRFFWSTVETVNKAVNEVNNEILNNGSVNLGVFHKALGLDGVSLSDHVGFNQHEMLELVWATGTTPDGQTPVHTFDYVNRPEVNYRESPFRR